MFQAVKKTYFTLLELLIVLFVISFGLILTGVKIKEIYSEQRFLSESQQILSHLAMAQDLMLIMDTDIQMKIVKDKNLKFWLEVEKPLNDHWAKFIERKIQLNAIQSIEFEGHKENDITLTFSLGQMSQGVLTLIGEKDSRASDKNKQFQIELSGYPGPFTAKSDSSKDKQKEDKSTLLYPVEVYEKLYADQS